MFPVVDLMFNVFVKVFVSEHLLMNVKFDLLKLLKHQINSNFSLLAE